MEYLIFQRYGSPLARIPRNSNSRTEMLAPADEFALAKNLCAPGNWPTHAWTIAYAPIDNPEVAVVAFVYNGGEGASVAGPIVRILLEAYFELNEIDAGLEIP